MTEILLGLAALWAFIHFGTGGSVSSSLPPTQVTPPGSVPVYTPGLPVPTSAPIPGNVSGSYQLTAASTYLAGGAAPGVLNFVGGGGAVPVTPPPPPPPYVLGGIAGTIGTGGNPLGGFQRPGVSPGTGSTAAPSAASWAGIKVIA